MDISGQHISPIFKGHAMLTQTFVSVYTACSSEAIHTV